MLSTHLQVKRNELPRVPKKLREAANEGANWAAERIVDVAFDLAPYDPEHDFEKDGPLHLREGIQALPIRAGSFRQIRVEATVFYSMFQEFGTSRNKAQPYFYPAIDLVWPQYVAYLTRLVRQVVT